VDEAFVQGGVGIGAQHGDGTLGGAVFLALDPAESGIAGGAGGAGQVADGAGDDGEAVTAFGQAAGQLVVAGAAGFVKRGEGLVDEQDVHKGSG
jgi:hypothetical protein